MLSAQSHPRRSLRILVVEDEAIIALALQQAIHSLGHVVCGVAASANAAISSAAQYRPDIALMDIRLHGDEDGIFAAEEIWTRYRIRSLFLSAFDTAPTHLRALAAKPLGFLPKPYRLDELRRALDGMQTDSIAC